MTVLKHRSFPLSHWLISFLRDKDIRGIRRLSVVLPRLLLPKVETVGEHILKTIHGFSLKINPSLDKGVELSLYETGTYEKGLLLLLNDFLKPGSCFIDVGANIGLMSVYASQLVGNKGKVISFEAHPETFNWLKFNIELNKNHNIEAHNFALGSEPSQMLIYDNWQVNRGGASLIVKDENSNSFPVDVKRLDDSLSKEIIPAVIKVDVEGFELEVLKGARQTIVDFKPILVIEISSLRTNHHENSELLDFIEDFGCYQFYKLAGTKERVSKLIQIHSRAEFPEHDNIICLPV